jgi:hypothetical protein
MSKKFLAVGDYVINPDLLAYAITDGSQLRIGFTADGRGLGRELEVSGEAAKELLRWLRLNAEFLTRGSGSGLLGKPAEIALEDVTRGVSRGSQGVPGQHWNDQTADALKPPESFFSRSR